MMWPQDSIKGVSAVMTKEAKVGMLTGLGVIVVIGVLLSEYLNTPPGVAPSSLATGKMAALPIGEGKRTQMLQEVGVPAMVQAESTAVSGGGGGGGLPSLPAAFAADTHRDAPLAAVPVSAGPVVGAPVSAVPAGPVQVASVQGLEAPATVQVEDTAFQPGAPLPVDAGAAVASDTGEKAKPVQVKVAGEEYVIAKGDGLGKIAAKFYKANTAENRERIVAANPSLMKDGQVFLMAGKKIVIPAVATAAAAPAVARQPVTTVAKVDPKKVQEPAVVIGLPGTKTTQNKAADVKVASAAGAPVKTDVTKADPAKKTDTKADSKKADGKVYVVKDGDSLEKIARRLDSENYQSAMKKIIAANGIKNASSLQVGDKLKLPL
jgi:LysM repeat protein